MQEALIFCFNLKKSAIESHRMLVVAYGDSALSEIMCRDWFRRFKDGHFDLSDKKRENRPREVEDHQLQACFRRWATRSLSSTSILAKTSENGLMSGLPRKRRNFFGVVSTNCPRDGKNGQLARASALNKFVFAFYEKNMFFCTLKKVSEIFPKIVGQLKIQMGRKFFQRYSQKYFRRRTGNSSYCLVGKISSLLGKIDIFHNLSGKRSKKSEQISVFVE